MRLILPPTMLVCLLLEPVVVPSLTADDALPPINERYRDEGVSAAPDFQRHVVPLFGRLGCNGRACHGSFQGRGGFRLSLFGYDFQADHDALFDKESPRVNPSKPLESLVIAKPTDADLHEGGQRYKVGSWQYHVLRRWIESGAKFEQRDVKKMTVLQVIPAEIEFQRTGQTVGLKCIAVWEDGMREDVTPLCRFQSNDDQVATIDQDGLVTAAKSGDTHVVAFYDKAVIPIPVIRPVSDLVGNRYPTVATPTRIDELVVAKLRKVGIVPSDVCTDAEFLRRVCLDMTGSLPTADEVRSFLADSAADKRQKKVDQLLASPAYAAWWTTKLCDFTGNNEEKLNNVGAVRGRATQDWWDWIHKRVTDNVPYDQIAAGVILGKSRNDGESYQAYCETMSAIARGENGRNYAERTYMPYYWARNNVRQPEERAIAFAYSFMGTRIECAQCHKHPFDQWSKDDFDQFKRFFTTVVAGNVNLTNLRGEEKEAYDKLASDIGVGQPRMNMNDRQRLIAEALKNGKTVPFPETFVNRSAPSNNRGKQKVNNRQPAASATGRLLGGEELDLSKFEDARQPLVDWLRDKNHLYFARAFVNRLWAAYFHAGIVTPTDDLSLANPPSNKPLLDYLTEGFFQSGFDMKWVHREIANSRTYQLSWLTNDTNQWDERNFSHAVPRRLPAEVAVDAIRQATASDAHAVSMRTEVKDRAISIPGASARNNRGPNFALGVFGRSTRDSNCDCDRSMEASLLQTVYLQNDMDVRTKLDARDSWVNEAILNLAKQRQVTASQQGGATGSEDLVAQIKSIERRLERVRQQQSEDQVQRLESQLEQLRKKVSGTDSKSTVDPKLAESLIETAYLRSLNRYPHRDELTIATNYVVADGDLARGLRDVMWALLNTKEFIVNH